MQSIHESSGLHYVYRCELPICQRKTLKIRGSQRSLISYFLSALHYHRLIFKLKLVTLKHTHTHTHMHLGGDVIFTFLRKKKITEMVILFKFDCVPISN